jgi:hypothetical protein
MSVTNDDDTFGPPPESLLQGLKDELGAECDGVSDEHLLSFLYWKPDVERASQRYRNFIGWKRSNSHFFEEKKLLVSEDPELERVILSEVIVSPPSLKTKDGGTILIGRFRNNDMTDGRTVNDVCRMLFYTIDQVIERREAQKHGVTIIHDLRGFNKSKNARLEVAKSVYHLFGHFPIKINAIYICHAPAVFTTFFKFVSTLIMTKKVRDRVQFINDFTELGDVHGIVDPNDLLTDLGGTLEWSAKDWIEEMKLKEQSGEWNSFFSIDPPAATEKS